jgi:hypothetical protein
MKLLMPSLALPLSMVLIGIVYGVASEAELPRDDETGPRKVEFAEVTGHACLQPVVRSADAVLQDFHAAERRWLSEHFAGQPALRWQNLLVVPPDMNGQYVDATVKNETAYVQEADGSEIKVCFDVGVDLPKKLERE